MRLLISIALQLLVSAGLIAVLLWRVDVSQVRHDLGSADWRWLGLAFPLFAASQVLLGVRWWLLVRPAGAVPLWQGVLARVTVTGLDLLLPFHPGYAALAQIMYRRYRVERAAVLGTLVGQGVQVLIALVLLALALAPFVSGNTTVLPRVVMLLALSVLLLGLAVLLIYRMRGRGVLQRVFPAAVAGWLERQAAQFASGFAALGRGSSILLMLLCTLAEWSAAAAGLAVVGQAIHVDAPLSTYFLAEILSYVSLAIPVTLRNVGPYELALQTTLTASDVDGDEAVAFALTAHALLLIVTAMTALTAAVALRLRWEDLFYVRAAQPKT